MTIAHYLAMVAAFVLICAVGATGQTKGVIQSETAPPKFCANESNESNDSTSESPVTDSSTIHEFGTSRFAQARAAAASALLVYQRFRFDKASESSTQADLRFASILRVAGDALAKSEEARKDRCETSS
jgi:hypothetical protein